MKLIAERDGEIIVIGEGYTFESACFFLSELEFDCEYNDICPYEGFDFTLVDGETTYFFDGEDFVKI